MKEQQHRPHIYELDPLRAITALSVVAVHVLAFTFFLNHSDVGVEIQNAVMIALHFTREVFMFVTAFAMVYVYYGKPFNLKRFWTKRSIGVLLPYCIWSMIYLLLNAPAKTPVGFIGETVLAIVRGTASYQLYYILLTIQFYLILPLFLLFLKRAAHRPWRVLAVAFAIQVAMLYADYHWLQQGTLASSSIIWHYVSEYQDRFLLTYPFYFVLGGITALYVQQIRAFLLRNGWMVASGFVFAIAMLWLHFVVQVQVYQESTAYASSVLQPIMAFYSLAVIFFMFWLASWWASHKGQNGHPRGYQFWHTLSNASFGVYLIHAILLAAILQRIVPVMPSAWPVAIRVFLVWFLTAGSSTMITLILLKIPVLSRLVGREHSAQKKAIQPARENKPEKQLQPVAAMAIQKKGDGKDAFPRSVIEPGPALSEMQRT